MKKIIINGAKTHNLKNIDVEIPRDKLTVITGLSGSGKSSLAFDTLYAEGQRRYVESLSSYARQFLSMMDKPEVEHIEGLSPAISIDQKTTSHNPRSTVGTVTEIYDYLRVFFARAGSPKCPTHHIELKAQTVSQMVDKVLEFDDSTRLMILAPVVSEKKGTHNTLMEKILSQGYIRVRINGEFYNLDEEHPELDRYKKHNIDVVVDRFKPKKDNDQRIAESIETALDLGNGIIKVANMNEENFQDVLFSSKHACPLCNFALKELTPRIFSFNSPLGACTSCDGLGVKEFFDEQKVIVDKSLSLKVGAIVKWSKGNQYYYSQLESLAKHYKFSLETPFEKLSTELQNIILYGSGNEIIEMTIDSIRGGRQTRSKTFEGVIPHFERRYYESDSDMVKKDLYEYMSNLKCKTCGGARVGEYARNIFIAEKNIADICALSIEDLLSWLDGLKFVGQQQKIAENLLKEIKLRVTFLQNVGLEYLSLSRQADTLSGGEAQRIRLASQIGAGLVGVMYILDEPSIGLHQRDNQRLLDALHNLKDLGNTVIVVEHDEDAIKQADFVIDMGPMAGVHGGEVVAAGTYDTIIKNKKSLTADYLSGRKKIEVPKKRLKAKSNNYLEIKGATGNNLHGDDLKIPMGVLTCVTGVSGSGKSTLINKTLYPLASRLLNRSSLVPMEYKSHKGFNHLDKVIDIDQSPIGRTPRSNPATYTGVFTPIREMFAATAESRARGYSPGRFSFNVRGGRCEACQGDGVIKVELHFLADVYVACDVCNGKRYNRETLSVHYKGKNIYEVLDMTVEEGLKFYDAVPSIKSKLEALMSVGLSYIKLGQSATTLSGGEAQRVKLAKELAKRSTGKTLYIMDEPTTGLHFYDIHQLLKVITSLRDKGNTVIIIEHNLDVIKMADWLIDLGPEGGNKGGQIIFEGVPEDIIKCKESYTGKYLQDML
ncbi:excinuclease ABC subunit UvrA [Francisella adeliensis]|uniref:UvrABC system protein A n=1 Tax=Francisella adeliensis TaxID=2007306 RepID=A0A2Z4XYE7_9GAMM|nr:excinuclease ABC subunit UvrA [Francisella adeliensis]AXA33648.1 excinuclease ABC subunit A [Francisella adeliensis]MBK2085107.1 excinuclease ABC subunit UvrA [Francisella adeliensis]MBK2097416.1 excinuclease ABC subunit UvrA [Francisella adeliensis]QIW11882.1 excinuclease ABC subunit UvrA [Francisella adeliensis]QIW13758.1 excinuclease ABC subunit UvrA [Francisella adeliensis]